MAQGWGSSADSRVTNTVPDFSTPGAVIKPLIIPRRGVPKGVSILGIWPPANHPSLLESHQSDPVRSHHHWEVLLGFPLEHSPYVLSGEALSPMTFLHSFLVWKCPGHRLSRHLQVLAKGAGGVQAGPWPSGSTPAHPCWPHPVLEPGKTEL